MHVGEEINMWLSFSRLPSSLFSPWPRICTPPHDTSYYFKWKASVYFSYVQPTILLISMVPIQRYSCQQEGGSRRRGLLCLPWANITPMCQCWSETATAWEEPMVRLLFLELELGAVNAQI